MAPLRQGNRIVVLVVEDEPLLLLNAADMLEEAGFDVVQATNADVAVRILENRTDIRIVFTDIDMPGSMDGMKLAAAVRDRWPPIEIVITSGHVTAANIKMPPRSVFFPKPYRDEEIVAQMRRMAA